MRRLVFLHGRSQQDKDASELKKTWIDSLRTGLEKSDLDMPIDEAEVCFIYYGDTLRDLCGGMSNDDAARVVYRGASASAEDEGKISEILSAYLAELEIDPDKVDERCREISGTEVITRGPQNWAWVLAIIRVIDEHCPGAGALIALATRDVHLYLNRKKIQIAIESGMFAVLSEIRERGRSADRDFSHDEFVLVAHSLGTIIAYKFLHELSTRGLWRVPLLVTLGSPLGIVAIRDRLRPISHPACVGRWVNARDPRDLVALCPLDAGHFKLDPLIDDSSHVQNQTSNRHGIEGYLNDREVARAIHDALVSVSNSA